MVVKLSDRVEVEWFKQVSPISAPAEGEIAVSGIGTIAAARVIPKDAPPFIAVSMYARWTSPHPSTNRTRWIYSNGSAHRIISDLSAFIGSTDPDAPCTGRGGPQHDLWRYGRQPAGASSP